MFQLEQSKADTTKRSLTVGSAVGSIRELFAKVKAIDAKHGKFDLLLCTGDFFGPVQLPGEVQPDDEVSQLLAGQIEREHRLPGQDGSNTDSIASAYRMLYHARGPTPAGEGSREVCNHWRRVVQESISDE